MDDGSLNTIVVHLFSTVTITLLKTEIGVIPTDFRLKFSKILVQQCQDRESTIPLGFAKYDLLIIEQKTSNGELFTTLAEHGPVI